MTLLRLSELTTNSLFPVPPAQRGQTVSELEHHHRHTYDEIRPTTQLSSSPIMHPFLCTTSAKRKQTSEAEHHRRHSYHEAICPTATQLKFSSGRLLFLEQLEN